MNTATAALDLSAYCRKCGDDLIVGMLCTRPGSSFVDNGAARDREVVPARYEGLCVRCCNHNHA